MMRVAEIGPHEERLVGGLAIEEAGELIGDFVISAHVQKVDAVGERPQMMLLIEPLDFGLSPRRAVEVIRAAANARVIAALLAQDFGERDLVAWQRRGESRHAG